MSTNNLTNNTNDNTKASQPDAQPASQASSSQQAITRLEQHINQHILGQSHLVKRLLIALLTDGHLLVEGAPGLAKTTAIKALYSGIEASFHRLQFTPDLLPSDLTGTEIFRPNDGSFEFQHGPLFHNLILADEINRAPAKVQSALLEAMAERQITVGRTTYQLPELFLVMATQNPIEQEGTYPLPEAQLDRFLLYTQIDYPDREAEKAILELARRQARGETAQISSIAPVSTQDILQARREILDLHMAPQLQDYIVSLVLATREPDQYDPELGKFVVAGGSPRATIALDRVARTHAWLAGRDFVTPDDIQTMALDVLRHRILLSFEAEAHNIDTDQVINRLLSLVAVP